MWQNKKFKGWFLGRYTYHRGERVFELQSPKRRITFESWQMAAKQGWVYTPKGSR